MIASEMVDNLILQARLEKQKEILNKVKKPYAITNEFLESQEKPYIISDLKIGTDGGLRMYLEGESRPIRGYADQPTVNLTAMYKRLFPLLAKSIKGQNIFGRAITIFSLYLNRNILSEWFSYIFDFGSYLLKDEHWSEPTKELRRVLLKHFDKSIVDGISLVFEYDSAYKYRTQDILSLIDKNFKTPSKEIERLFKIYSERDNDGVKEKVGNMIKLIKTSLIVPKFNKILREILSDIDIKKIGFNEDDMYWINKMPNYKYLGKEVGQRL